MVFLEPYAKLIQFLHLFAGVTAVAACSHLLIRMLRSRRDARVRTHAMTLLIAYLSAYLLGSLQYPTFRVRARYEFLDQAVPWATGLFEMKEHFATLTLLPVIGIFVLTRRRPTEGSSATPHPGLLASLGSVVLLVLLFNACVGWYLGTLKG